MWEFQKLKNDVAGVLLHQLNGMFWGQISQPSLHQIGDNLQDILSRQFRWQMRNKIKEELKSE